MIIGDNQERLVGEGIECILIEEQIPWSLGWDSMGNHRDGEMAYVWSAGSIWLDNVAAGGR